VISKIAFLAKARERRAEAYALVAECPAEEERLSTGECLEMARRLVGENDLELEFAVFDALLDRSIARESDPAVLPTYD
jgi:hypothetical protein